MEDVKWMFRKCGFPILIFLFVVIVGTVCWEKLKTEKPQKCSRGSMGTSCRNREQRRGIGRGNRYGIFYGVCILVRASI